MLLNATGHGVILVLDDRGMAEGGKNVIRGYQGSLTILAFWIAVPVFAQIGPSDPVDTEWRPSPTTVEVGQQFQIGFYGVGTGDAQSTVSNFEAALSWNPEHLRLIGKVDNGPYRWLFSGFPAAFSGFDPEGLNESWADGDAQYLASRQFAPLSPFFAPNEGRLVTTFIFEALAETPATFIESPSFRGANRSRVFDGLIPNLDITGTLGHAEVRIVPEPASLGLLAMGFGALIWTVRQRRLRATN